MRAGVLDTQMLTEEGLQTLQQSAEGHCHAVQAASGTSRNLCDIKQSGQHE
jgi:hypothetical protein